MKKSKKVNKEIDHNEKFKDDVCKEVYKIMDKFGDTGEKRSYVAYLIFNIIGYGLLDFVGEEKFKELVSVVIKGSSK